VFLVDGKYGGTRTMDAVCSRYPATPAQSLVDVLTGLAAHTPRSPEDYMNLEMRVGYEADDRNVPQR
jgi:hypothetical protein